MSWTCPSCGLVFRNGIRVWPVHCRCGNVWQSDGSTYDPKSNFGCIHLGDATGDVVSCGGCNGRDLPVLRCAVHGVTVARKPIVRAGKPTWDGMNCLECRTAGHGYKTAAVQQEQPNRGH